MAVIVTLKALDLDQTEVCKEKSARKLLTVSLFTTIYFVFAVDHSLGYRCR